MPEGRSVVVTAPVAGTLTGAAGSRAGVRVRQGERLMTIAPLVAAERDQRIEAQRAVTARRLRKQRRVNACSDSNSC